MITGDERKEQAELVVAVLSRNLRRLRRQAGLSQSALGEKAGLHRTEIALLEAQKRAPKLDTFVLLCQGLKVQPGQLLDGLPFPTE